MDLMETCCIHPIYFVTDLRLLKKEKREKKNVAIAGCKTGYTVKKPPKSTSKIDLCMAHFKRNQNNSF